MDTVNRVFFLIKRNFFQAMTYNKRNSFGKDRKSRSSLLYYFTFVIFFFVFSFLNCWKTSNSSSFMGYGFMSLIFSMVFPLLVTQEYDRKTDREFGIMLPASTAEKFWAWIIASYIIFPTFVIAQGFIGSYSGTLLGNFVFNGNFTFANNAGNFFYTITPMTVSLTAIMIATILLMGLLFKNIIAKTIASVVTVFLLMIFMVIAKISAYSDGWPELDGDLAVYVIYPLAAVALAACTYIKLKRERA